MTLRIETSTQLERSPPVPPAFGIWSDRPCFFAVEISNDAARLLRADTRLRDVLFWGSWQDGLVDIGRQQSFQVPVRIWSRFVALETVHYRAISSARQREWVDVETSADVLGDVGSITLRGLAPQVDPRPVRAEESLWRRPELLIDRRHNTTRE